MTPLSQFRVIAISPFRALDLRLLRALSFTRALTLCDLRGTDTPAEDIYQRISPNSGIENFGFIISEATQPSDIPHDAIIVASGPTFSAAGWLPRITLAQVTSLEEANQALSSGAAGLILKGAESGDRVSEESAFVLFQRVRRLNSVPMWIQGGIGPHTAAAAVAGGATGVVLDVQLALTSDSSLDGKIRQAIAGMDGSETAVFAGHRVFSRPDLKPPQIPEGARIDSVIGSNSLSTQFLPCGQDGALAAPLANQYRSAGRLIRAIWSACDNGVRLACDALPLAPYSPFARHHGIEYPILQGPMTRVSDTAAFAESVASAGGLPFIALAMLRGSASLALLRETRERLKERPWGVGLLGFVDPDLRAEQLAAIQEVKPPAALIAGGRPSQARALEDQGIKTYLHVPSPGLLKLFLADGSRRFIFEGRECGGHVGPRYSFALWEQQIAILEQFSRPQELFLVFAGGIHDTVSAAMISAMTATLASRGAHIGILMGTAYLFTEEAVAAGAVVPEYQKQALQCNRTVLLETAPGHATRCVDTEYVGAFRAERERLESKGLDAKSVWATLEQLNLGRLRIASKGIKRTDSGLTQVGEEEQQAEGMYMIGDVATMHDRVVTARELHTGVTAGVAAYLEQLAGAQESESIAEPIDVAIIGMAGVFPGADDVDEFWSKIVNSGQSFSQVDPARWNPNHYFDPASTGGDKVCTTWGGYLGDIHFNPTDYGIPPHSLTSIDPTQLLALEVARRAMDDAGYGKDTVFDRSRVSVVFGAEAGSELTFQYAFRSLYPQLMGVLPAELDAHLPRLTEDSFPGVLSNVVAGRIANRLDLGGTNLSVDAACASSLAALDIAAKELTTGSSDMVLCGGADLHNGIHDHLLFAGVHALSRSDRCRTFDSQADGTMLGEAVACVVLKRLTDAVSDGDRIYAVIKGVGSSSDGRSLGLTAPRKEGQMRALERAYSTSGLTPRDVELVEAHGTGTVVGDRTELGTLTAVFEHSGATPGQCTLGSVKSQIGHTKCAAGLASLIKVSKSIYHRVLPPTLNVETPNPAYQPETSPFTLSTFARPWLSPRRCAGVSAFGFGGANFHAVLEAHNSQDFLLEGHSVWPFELVQLRGSSPSTSTERAKQLANLLSVKGNKLRLRDVAATLAKDTTNPVQFALVASSVDDLRAKLLEIASGQVPTDCFRRQDVTGKVAFLFSGQGSQRPGMLRDLFLAFPQLRSLLELADKALVEALFPPQPWTPQQNRAHVDSLKDTRKAQPALGIVELALWRLFAATGVKPDMSGGHSYGELVALACAGAFSEHELIELSRARAEAILGAVGSDPGRMVAVSAAPDTILRHLEEYPDVVIANHNAPQQIVVSGTSPAISQLLETLQTEGISAREIPVAAAFHSPLVASASAHLKAALDKIALGELDTQVWSNSTAEAYASDPEHICTLLAEHVARPVSFVEQIEAMYESGARTFVEVGPGRVLTNLVDKILAGKTHQRICTDSDEHSGLHGILRAFGQLATFGYELKTSILFGDGRARILNLSRPESLEPSPATWRINGWIAEPLKGNPPENRVKPNIEPVFSPSAAASPVATTTSSDRAAVLSYLDNLRQLAAAQRDVLVQYLGGEPHAARAVAAAPTAQEPLPIRQGQSLPSTLSTNNAPRPQTKSPPASRKPAAQPDVETTLINLFSSKTGYPADMLGLDQDLEADLSIDSIKRVEILGALADELSLAQPNIQDRDNLIEQLAAQKTMRGIANWLNEQSAVQAPSQPSTPARAASDDEIRAAQSAPSVTVPAAEPPDHAAALLELVSEKTGYPLEMLGLDQDLEAELSIDSIKRVEILGAFAERVGLSASSGADERDRMIEALAAKKTLRDILAWTRADQPSVATKERPSEASNEAIPSEAKSAASSSHSIDIAAKLLNVVAEKTGYPPEMLGLDQDLEAELSIDSIKRAEILGVLADNIGATYETLAERDRMIEELAAKKTLREIVDRIKETSTENLTDNSSVTRSPGDYDSAPVVFSIHRYVPRLSVAALDDTSPSTLAGQSIGIAGASPELFAAIREALGCIGAGPIGTVTENIETTTNTLIFIAKHTASTSDDPSSAAERFFKLAQQALRTGTQRFLVVIESPPGERSLPGALSTAPRLIGLAGQVKTIAKEYPERRAKAVRVPSSLSCSALASLIIDELRAADPRAEVVYKDGIRHHIDAQLARAVPAGDLPLGQDAVVLITGGGRGITAGAAESIARRARCHLVLVGRSPQSTAADLGRHPEAHTMVDLRRSIIAEGELKEPKSIERECRRLFSARALNATLAAVTAAGGTYEYHAMDVSDRSRFQSLIQDLYKTHGRLDGVIHGAGIIEDSFIENKTTESFRRVYQTKVSPAHALLESLRPDVKFVVFFSSVSGFFGNRGQIDYAGASDALDQIAAELQARVEGRVLSIDWGPWGGTGMVSDSLAQQYESRGVGLIPFHEGLEHLLNEIATQDRESPQVIYVAAEPEVVRDGGGL